MTGVVTEHAVSCGTSKGWIDIDRSSDGLPMVGYDLVFVSEYTQYSCSTQ